MQDSLGGVFGRIVSCCTRTCPCTREKGQNNRSTQPDSSGAVVVIPDPIVPKSVSPSNSSPVPVQPATNVYKALYDYHARTAEDLSFREGDQLEILDKTNPDWWHARALNGVSAKRSGYIPANYVAPLESLHAQPWYFPDTKRVDAEKLLLSEGNQHGAFLIRQCESQPGELSMSVFDNSDGKVKHYKIKQLDGGLYYVTRSQTFSTLNELVEYYRHTDNGLCVQLGEPCRKVIAPQTKGLSYNTMDQWEIPRSSIQLIRQLGNGQFGQVYEGLWNHSTPVAVKTPKQGSMNRDDFLREAQIMKKLLHPKLIQLYAVCTIGEPIYIITELMKHGSLLDYLRKDKGNVLGVTDQVEMAGQVAAGMAYLEQQNYIHRDLAARNVLVGENNMCKVADFGLARVFMKETDDEDGDEDEGVYEVTHGTKLPVKWTAPEALHDNIFTIKSDVWSFGILLYEIVTYGKSPYPSLTNGQVYHMVHNGYRMACPTNCPRRLYELMMDCWKNMAPDRPTFETLQWRLEEFYEMDVSSYDDVNRY